MSNWYLLLKQAPSQQQDVKESSAYMPSNDALYQGWRDFQVCLSGSKKCSFFGKFDLLCFLETPVLRFALLPYYRRTVKCGKCNKSITQCDCLLMRSYDNSAWLNLEAVAERSRHGPLYNHLQNDNSLHYSTFTHFHWGSLGCRESVLIFTVLILRWTLFDFCKY